MPRRAERLAMHALILVKQVDHVDDPRDPTIIRDGKGRMFKNLQFSAMNGDANSIERLREKVDEFIESNGCELTTI